MGVFNQAFTLNRVEAEDFLEVYKTVVAEYAEMVTELTSGLCIALEVGYSFVGNTI